MKHVPVIECDKELLGKLSTKLQFAITGKTVFFTDSLVDLVKRHCPEIYDMAKEAGFRFVPSSDSSELEQFPPRIWFDVIRDSSAH